MTSAAPIVCVLQARMGSTRLPGKILKDLAGAPMLQRLIERVRSSRLIDALVVATTDQPEDDAVESLCDNLGVACFRGSSLDVLSRFVTVGRNVGAKNIVRLTGDNPFVDGLLIDRVVQAFLDANPPVDYANNIEGSGYPYGLYVEVVRYAALLDSDACTNPDDREHVTRFVRSNPAFRCMTVKSDRAYKCGSLTVDTAEDYEQIKRLFEPLFKITPEFPHTFLQDNPK